MKRYVVDHSPFSEKSARVKDSLLEGVSTKKLDKALTAANDVEALLKLLQMAVS